MTPSCLQHAQNPVTSHCVRCGRTMCDLCSFWVGTALFCPECLSSGPSADERTSVAVRGFLSVGLGILALLALVGYQVAMDFVSSSSSMAVHVFLTRVSTLLALGGVALGLIGREGARRTGSVVPLVGVLMNAVLIAVVTAVTIIPLIPLFTEG